MTIRPFGLIFIVELFVSLSIPGRLAAQQRIANNRDIPLRGAARQNYVSPEQQGWIFNAEEVDRVHREYSVDQLYTANDNTRYVWMHLDEFMPTASIGRGGSISRLEKTIIPEIGRITAKTELGEMSLDEFIGKSDLQGIIVLHKGKIVYERYPRMRPEDKHIYYSITKPFVSLAVATLEEQGKLNAKDEIGKYLPELNRSDWGKVPIIHILNMTSGMSGRQLDDPGAASDTSNTYYQFASNIGIAGRTSATSKSIWDVLNKMYKFREPGTFFEYASTNTIILSLLVERLSNQPFAEYVSEHFWKKIGAEADAYIGLSPTGIASTSATMCSNLRDLARFGLLFTPSYRTVSREKIVSDRYMLKLRNSGAPGSAYDKGRMGQIVMGQLQERPDHNSYQWDFVMKDGDFGKLGTHGQAIYISPARDLVLACFSHGDHSNVAYLRAIARSSVFNK